jgi:hypothetical protein
MDNIPITWTRGDPAGVVTIERGSLVTIASQTAMTEFACITPIPAQPFTIPASVLLSLAAESQTPYLCHFRFG